MMARREMLAVLAASAGAVTAGAGATEAADDAEAVCHVAIFRFADEHVAEAVAASRELAAATRWQEGNRAYDVFRGVGDGNAFTLVERWASPAALAGHEKSEAFIRLGRGVLTRYATLHDTITGRPLG